MFEPNTTILFQGDSITDAGRDRTIESQANVPAALGRGYAFLTAARLLAQQPQLNIFNRGISGNRITNLQTRWHDDCLALKPDVLSVLIGINDTWHGTAKGTPANGVPIDRFESVFCELISQARDANPDITLVICDPFTTECGAVTELAFHPDIDHRREAVHRVALQYDAIFVPFQQVFDDAVARAGDPSLLAADGVHPTLAGHQAMADAWLHAVNAARP